jgi:hypothetical protein
LKELDRNVGEKEVDQTDANPGTDYKDISWQDGRRIVELSISPSFKNGIYDYSA